MRLYEGMFLVDNAEARKDFDRVSKHVAGIIAKYGGEVKRSERWAERRLAYPVRRRDRGTYILVYFNASPESIAQIKRDYVIDEVVFRTIILRVNAMPQEKVEPEPAQAPSEKAAPQEPPGKEEAPAAESEELVPEVAVEAVEETAEAQGTEQAAEVTPEAAGEVAELAGEAAEVQGTEQAAEVTPEAAGEVAELAGEAAEVQGTEQAAEVTPEAAGEVAELAGEVAEVQGTEQAAEVAPEAAVPSGGSAQEDVGAADEKPEGEVTDGQADPVEEVP